MDKNLIGEKLIYLNFNYKICKVEKIGIVGDKEYYFINEKYPDPITNGMYVLYDKDRMKFILEHQEKWKDAKQRQDQRDKENKAREDKEARDKADKENLYGFTKGKTPMQHGKILKTLMVKVARDGKLYTRKDLMIKIATEGGKSGEKRRIFLTENTFIEVTKTEHDFFNYLIDYNIIESENIA